ncbi:unnamed protein product, partial [Ectocarpus sp. 12 AP-2014]
VTQATSRCCSSSWGRRLTFPISLVKRRISPGKCVLCAFQVGESLPRPYAHACGYNLASHRPKPFLSVFIFVFFHWQKTIGGWWYAPRVRTSCTNKVIKNGAALRATPYHNEWQKAMTLCVQLQTGRRALCRGSIERKTPQKKLYCKEPRA